MAPAPPATDPLAQAQNLVAELSKMRTAAASKKTRSLATVVLMIDFLPHHDASFVALSDDFAKNKVISAQVFVSPASTEENVVGFLEHCFNELCKDLQISLLLFPAAPHGTKNGLSRKAITPGMSETDPDFFRWSELLRPIRGARNIHEVKIVSDVCESLCLDLFLRPDQFGLFLGTLSDSRKIFTNGKYISLACLLFRQLSHCSTIQEVIAKWYVKFNCLRKTNFRRFLD